MTQTIRRSLILAALVSCATHGATRGAKPAHAAEPAQAAEPAHAEEPARGSALARRIDRLHWLAGGWQSERGGRTIHELWMAPSGGMMLGIGHTVDGEKTIEYEAMRIEERGGDIVFTAKPSGQEQASFTATELTDSSVVFANPAHDFPQRVIYRLRPDGSLLARIEGEIGGKARAVDYPMERARDASSASGASSSPRRASPADAADFTGRGFAPVNETRLCYEVAGRGEPLVLIHGGQLDSRMWDEQFELFTKEFRVLRYDVRGYGGSGDLETPYSDAGDLAALLEYVGMTSKAHFVGLSLGGRIAIDFALTHPERVASLALAGPGLDGFEGGDGSEGARWWAMVQAARDDGAPKAIEMWLSDPYMAPAMEHADLAPRIRRLSLENQRDWLGNPILQRSPRPSPAARLAEIRVPTLIILGDRDVPRIAAIVDTLSSGIAGAEKVVVRGAGHMVSMEKPEEFNRAVLGFLRGLRGAGR